MSGSSNLRIFGYSSVWVFESRSVESLNFRIFDSLDLWIFEYPNFWIFRYSNIWIFKYSNVRIFEFSSLRIFGYWNVWIFEFLNIWIFESLSLWIFRYSSLWILKFSNLRILSKIFKYSKYSSESPSARIFDSLILQASNLLNLWPNISKYLNHRVILWNPRIVASNSKLPNQRETRLFLHKRVRKPRRTVHLNVGVLGIRTTALQNGLKLPAHLSIAGGSIFHATWPASRWNRDVVLCRHVRAYTAVYFINRQGLGPTLSPRL